MFLWFVVCAPVLVAEIFQSPKVDYRLVSFGAVFPMVGFLFLPSATHSFFFPVVVLTVVMLATIGKRLLRRRLLGFPIGLFCHLVLDASWESASVFWWPLFGSEQAQQIPESSHVVVRILLEVVAVLLLVWAAKRYRLTTQSAQKKFLRSGHLPANYLS